MKVYALKNGAIKDSSSGGAFPTIIDALQKISEDSNRIIVYGAVFDDDFNVIHKRAASEKDYANFRGSKYVLSRLGTSFIDVENDLSNGHTVLFSGTPCQIDALYFNLRRKNIDCTRLYTVDIVCHGTPDPQLWRDYIYWIEKKYGGKLTDYSFRYPNAKWKLYPVMAEFSTGKKYVNTYYLRQYMMLFLKKIVFRECCYSCKFSNLNRISDITIGDFWGIRKVLPQFGYENNVSEVLINTPKGELLFDEIIRDSAKNDQLSIMECRNDDYLIYQHNLNSPTIKPVLTEQFRIDYKKYGFEYVLKKYGSYSFTERCKHTIRRLKYEVLNLH